MLRKIRQMLKGTKGQGMVEYGLIVALIAVVVIVAVRALGTNSSTKFKNAADEIAK